MYYIANILKYLLGGVKVGGMGGNGGGGFRGLGDIEIVEMSTTVQQIEVIVAKLGYTIALG